MPPLFLIVKNQEKVIRLCSVLIFLSGSFEDRGNFHVIQLSYDGGRALCAHYRSIDKFVKNGPIFKTTTLKKHSA